MSGFQPAFCTSCQAVIVWTETPAGERMPIDYQPHADGTLALTRRPGDTPPLARFVKVSQRFGRRDLHRSHFSSCPNADEHRKPRRPAPRGRWLAANAPTDQPYPCRCASSEQGCRQGGTHCPCAGRTDVDHLPATCCARRTETKEHQP